MLCIYPYQELASIWKSDDLWKGSNKSGYAENSVKWTDKGRIGRRLFTGNF